MAKQISIFECFGQPNRKAPSSDAKTKKRAGDAQYDSNRRQRVFNPDWEKEYPWLVYNKEAGTMKCKVCTDNTHKRAEKSPWSTGLGTKSMQRSSVRSHDESEKHQREQEAVDAARSKDRPANRAINQMRTEQRGQLCHKFRTVHALVKHHRPFTDYIWMNNLDKIKGVDVGANYESDKSAAVFADRIAEVGYIPSDFGGV